MIVVVNIAVVDVVVIYVFDVVVVVGCRCVC